MLRGRQCVLIIYLGRARNHSQKHLQFELSLLGYDPCPEGLAYIGSRNLVNRLSCGISNMSGVTVVFNTGMSCLHLSLLLSLPCTLPAQAKVYTLVTTKSQTFFNHYIGCPAKTDTGNLRAITTSCLF